MPNDTLRRVVRRVTPSKLRTAVKRFLPPPPERPEDAGRFRDIFSQRLLPFTLRDLPPAFNLLIPSVGPEQIFGGVATAVKLLIEIARRGHRVRLLVTDAPLPPSSAAAFREYVRQHHDGFEWPEDALMDVSPESADPGVKVLGRHDVFIATIWYTAWLAWRAIGHYGFAEPRFIYLIQDFEPGFYAWGQDYALAAATYRFENYYPIYNTHWLRDYFHDQGLVPDGPETVLRPEVDQEVFAPAPADVLRGRPRRVFIYGRPQIGRNLFPMLISGLDLWVRSGAVDPSEVEFVSAGHPHPPVRITRPDGGPDVIIRSVGKLSLSAYPETLRGFDLGISLMLSPHPSYPPLEMASSGLVTVTNRFANKNLESLSGNFVSCDPNPESLAEAIGRAWSKLDDVEARVRQSRFEFPRSLPLAAAVGNALADFLSAPVGYRGHSPDH
jgi:hypothetical protein